MWPTVVVLTSIGRDVRHSGFFTIYMWVKCSMFNPVMYSKPFGPSETSEIGHLHGCAAEVEGEGYWDLSELSDGLELVDHASVCFVHDQLFEEGSTFSLRLPTSAIDLGRLAVCNVSALSDIPCG